MSFMMSEEFSVGSIHLAEAERKAFAKKSLDWNMKNKVDKFEERFDKYFVKMGLREAPKEEVKEEELPKLGKKGSKVAEKKSQEEVKQDELPKLGKRASKEAGPA